MKSNLYELLSKLRTDAQAIQQAGLGPPMTQIAFAKLVVDIERCFVQAERDAYNRVIEELQEAD